MTMMYEALVQLCHTVLLCDGKIQHVASFDRHIHCRPVAYVVVIIVGIIVYGTFNACWLEWKF